MARRLHGIGVAGGLALGPAVVVRPAASPVGPATSGDQADRLRAAVAAARADLDRLASAADRRSAADAAAILRAQVLFLDDPALIGAACQRVEGKAATAEAALVATHSDLAVAFAAIEDSHLRARAQDLADVVDRLLAHLASVPPLALPATPVVVIAAELPPSAAAALDPARCLALALETGGPTSHTAIIARSLGIPTVVAVSGLLGAVSEGEIVMVDGTRGEVVVAPSDHEVAFVRRQERAAGAGPTGPATGSAAPAVTRDGLMVGIAANIDGIASAQRAVAAGADGVGLFRTEALFLDRASAPDEDEQWAAFRAVAREAGASTIVVRTLDIGGDKAAPALRLPAEANPFLGLRGLRLCLRRPDLFVPHLRAILRATADGRLAIMFPMVTSAGEIGEARALLTETRMALLADGHPMGEPPPVGVMIETPAAALTIDLLAPLVDFVSVGTNDLTQYTLAADRTNAAVAALADPYHPAHLRLLASVAAGARAAGIGCHVCGEMAADPIATALLIGLGFTELSMAPVAILAAKTRVRALDSAEARALAEAALAQPDAAAVRALLTPE
ncbi:MAG: phosphoenolpyruvate--protein phosphotransferase [Chloroflexi bacterium]|nr:phosphoenolpyruvate--protein phosphotransferase [Chloroflexota bacterium]